MPMTYTDSMVRNRLKALAAEVPVDPQHARERLADLIEEGFGDYIDAWEVRTGRPWTTMTPKEAEALLVRQPRLINNPGLLSRLIPLEGEY